MNVKRSVNPALRIMQRTRNERNVPQNNRLADERLRDEPRTMPVNDDQTDDAIEANTTVDVIVHPDGSVTEISDTVDAMDGAAVEVIDITNETDGTGIELTIIEEPSDTPGVDSVDRFVQIDGIGPQVADLLAKAGIRRFSQLAETPVERILDILTATGSRYRLHDAKAWQQQARLLADGQPTNQRGHAQA